MKFQFETTNFSYIQIFLSQSEVFSLKNTSKLGLQYLFNVFISFKTAFYFKLCLKLKVD